MRVSEPLHSQPPEVFKIGGVVRYPLKQSPNHASRGERSGGDGYVFRHRFDAMNRCCPLTQRRNHAGRVDRNEGNISFHEIEVLTMWALLEETTVAEVGMYPVIGSESLRSQPTDWLARPQPSVPPEPCTQD